MDDIIVFGSTIFSFSLIVIMFVIMIVKESGKKKKPFLQIGKYKQKNNQVKIFFTNINQEESSPNYIHSVPYVGLGVKDKVAMGLYSKELTDHSPVQNLSYYKTKNRLVEQNIYTALCDVDSELEEITLTKKKNNYSNLMVIIKTTAYNMNQDVTPEEGNILSSLHKLEKIYDLNIVEKFHPHHEQYNIEELHDLAYHPQTFFGNNPTMKNLPIEVILNLIQK